MKFVDLTGLKVGRLTVIRSVRINKRFKWECVCECGNTRLLSNSHLRRKHTKSCGCYRKEIAGLTALKRPYESLYNNLISEAKRRELECTITYEDFLKFTEIAVCYYCPKPIKWSKHGIVKNGMSYNLDRIICNLGYTLENCVVCCKRCNRAKSDLFTYEQWKSIGQHIKDNPELFGD